MNDKITFKELRTAGQVHLLAVDLLKDADGKYSIRDYFGLQ